MPSLLSWLQRLVEGWLKPQPGPPPDPPPPPPPVPTLDEVRRELLAAFNKAIASHGVPAKTMSHCLNGQAQSHATWMNGSGRINHDGFEQRVRACDMMGPPFPGEIVAKGQRNVTEVMASWRSSPSHWQIITANHAEVGIGWAGNSWCAIFGTKRAYSQEFRAAATKALLFGLAAPVVSGDEERGASSITGSYGDLAV